MFLNLYQKLGIEFKGEETELQGKYLMKKVFQKWINGSKDLHLYQGQIMMSVLSQCRWLVILIDNLIDFEKLKKKMNISNLN